MNQRVIITNINKLHFNNFYGFNSWFGWINYFHFPALKAYQLPALSFATVLTVGPSTCKAINVLLTTSFKFFYSTERPLSGQRKPTSVSEAVSMPNFNKMGSKALGITLYKQLYLFTIKFRISQFLPEYGNFNTFPFTKNRKRLTES